MPVDPHGWTIFCDDIRPEVGGKFSFMGVYRGIMFVHSDFPVTLPKFGLAIHYRVDFDDARLGDVSVNIFLPGDGEREPSVQAVIPVSKMIVENDPASAVGDTFREFGFNVILAPLTLKERGRVRVRAVGGAGVIKLGSIRVERGPTNGTPATNPN